MTEVLFSTLVLILLQCSSIQAKKSCEEADYISCNDGSGTCFHSSWICDGEVDCEISAKDESNCKDHVCKEDEFRCNTGQCVPLDAKCDHQVDCHDTSDEEGCVWECKVDEFQCKRSGKCLPKHLRCNGGLDCGAFDDSDEVNCVGRKECIDRQFHCYLTYGECISVKWRCDGEKDCLNGEDEHDCDGLCEKGILCDYTTKCIASAEMCDNHRHCADGKDESPNICHEECKAPDKWACGGKNYGYCIDSTSVCDGFVDCHDQSDESNCGGAPESCGGTDFQCTTGECLPAGWRCDGSNDCDDGVVGGSDEANCDSCSEGEYMCGGEDKTCISKTKICDGVADCKDANDEAYCSKIGNPGGCFPCAKNPKCIPNKYYCDGTDHCGDMSDEPAECGPYRFCQGDNGGCDHICEEKPYVGGFCDCNRGYVLAADNKTCLDIDECRGTGLVCSQTCINTKGSYFCACEPGYHLDTANNKSCVANEPEGYLVFSNTWELKTCNLNGTVSKLLVKNNSNIVDYNYRKKLWFWVTVTAIESSTVHVNEINQMSFDESSPASVIYNSTDYDIHSIAVDWITDKLYVCAAAVSERTSLIGVVDTATKRFTVIVYDANVVPPTIALDPRNGFMFWSSISNRQHKNGVIMQSEMDGNKKRVIRSNVYVNGLTLDYARRKVIFIDSNKAIHTSIMEMNYDGTNLRHIRVFRNENVKLWSVTLFEDYIYWTNSAFSNESVVKCNRFNTSHTDKIRSGLQGPKDIKVVHPLRQPPARNHCNHSNCEFMCLLKHVGYTCACPQDMVLTTDGVSCTTSNYLAECRRCFYPNECKRINESQFKCIHVNYTPITAEPSSPEESSEKDSIVWWIILIIVLLAVVFLIVAVLICKNSFRKVLNNCNCRNMESSTAEYHNVPQTTATTLSLPSEGTYSSKVVIDPTLPPKPTSTGRESKL